MHALPRKQRLGKSIWDTIVTTPIVVLAFS